MSSIQHLFDEKRVFNPAFSHPHLKDLQEFKKLYQESIQEPEKFWAKIAEDFFWFKKWDKVLSYDWKDKIESRWFEGAQTNLCYNALDRHLEKKSEQLALIWEGNESQQIRKFTYGELHAEVCKVANALKEMGVKQGDRVALYMGMVPELMMALLACSRIGAVHNVIFGGFSADSLKDRIVDCGAKFLLTADGLFRGPKTVSLKKTADEALKKCEAENHKVEKCLVFRHTQEKIEIKEGRDLEWKDLVAKQNPSCEAEKMDAEDPLFILYTSGSTGKPKGVVHSMAGYMVYVATTFKYLFPTQEKDLFWCTADIGWVTGHSYLTYGPLLNGTTTLMFEGVPNYPEPDRFWEVIDRHQVTHFYTAPTALRALMKEGESWVHKHSLESLKLLGSVGEPINPEAWIWYYENVGKSRCPIVDTWWQTETGGILVSPIPGITPLKPASAALPFFGVQGKVIQEKNAESKEGEGGLWVLEKPWPSILRGVWNQSNRVKETYFSQYPGLYFSGDGARVDEDSYVWFMGRVDDVLNVSGHRIGTAEIESALVKHPAVAEAAVVGFPHEIKGQGIYAFVTPKSGSENPELEKQLIAHLAQEIGPIAKPDHLILAPALPKTRSGKIMRRILRKIAEGDLENLGDTSTLAEPAVVDELVKSAQTKK